MSKFIKGFLFVITFLLFIYILPASPDFPKPPPDAVQSREPADSESPMRRAYFTNLNREEVIAHYKNTFNEKNKLPTLRLNYPPEESARIIRDQTKSTYLEELVHPLRESLYINGFEPKFEKDTITINGIGWNQKIIVKYVPSSVWIRIVVLLGSFISSYFLINEYKNV